MKKYMVVDTGKDGCALYVENGTPKSVYYFKQGYRSGFIDCEAFRKEIDRLGVRHFYVERVPLILHGSHVKSFAIQHQIIGQIYGTLLGVPDMVIHESYPQTILGVARKFLKAPQRNLDSKKLAQAVAAKIYPSFFSGHKKRTKVHEALGDTLMQLAFIERARLADLFEED